MFRLLFCVPCRDQCIFNFISWFTNGTYTNFPFRRLSPQEPETTIEEKKPHHPSRIQVYSREVFLDLALQEKKRELRGKECGRRREKGVHICMPSCSLTAVCTDNSCVLFLRFSMPVALGFSVESENGFLPFSRHHAVPMATRATNFSVHFYFFLPRFAGAFLLP